MVVVVVVVVLLAAAVVVVMTVLAAAAVERMVWPVVSAMCATSGGWTSFAKWALIGGCRLGCGCLSGSDIPFIVYFLILVFFFCCRWD